MIVTGRSLGSQCLWSLTIPPASQLLLLDFDMIAPKTCISKFCYFFFHGRAIFWSFFWPTIKQREYLITNNDLTASNIRVQQKKNLWQVNAIIEMHMQLLVFATITIVFYTTPIFKLIQALYKYFSISPKMISLTDR